MNREMILGGLSAFALTFRDGFVHPLFSQGGILDSFELLYAEKNLEL